jgi:hypothetical protein
MATSQEIQQLHQTMKDFVQSQSRLTEETRHAKQAISDMNDELHDYETTLGSTAKLTKKQNELYNKAYRAKQKELQIGLKVAQTQKRLEELNNKIAAAGTATLTQEAEIAKLNALLIIRTRNHGFALDRVNSTAEKFNNTSHGLVGSILRTQESLSELGGGFSGLVGRLGFVGVALGGLASLIGGIVNQGLKALDVAGKSMANTAGMVEGPTLAAGINNQINQALARGLPLQELQKMTAATRQTVNAMGGLNSSLTMSDELSRSYFGSTGDVVEAQKNALKTMESFLLKGVVPSRKGLQKYGDDVNRLQKLTGMGLEQSRDYFEGVAHDTNSLKNLRLVRDGERNSIIENQRALLANNIALGMSTEQASEAAKSLSEITGAKPMDRIKKATNVHAMFAQMGMGKEGAAISKEIMLGALGDQGVINAGFQKLTNAIEGRIAAKGADLQQRLPTELLYSTMIDKFGLEKELGSAFSTRLATKAAAPEGIEGKYSDFQKTALADAVQIKQMTTNNIAALTDGTIALKTAVSLMGDTLSAQSNLLSQYKSLLAGGINNTDTLLSSTSSFLENLGPKLMTSMSDAGNRAIEVVLAPFQAIAIGFYSIGENIANILSKVAGFLGLNSIEKGWAIAADRMSGMVAGYSDQFMKHWDQASTKQTEALKQSIPKEQPKLQQTVDLEKEKFAKDAQIQVADYSKQILESSQKQTTNFTDQLTKLDESSRYLKILADNSVTLISLSEKQLAAATMTAEEKTKYAGVLKRSDLAFGAEFATIK